MNARQIIDEVLSDDRFWLDQGQPEMAELVSLENRIKRQNPGIQVLDLGLSSDGRVVKVNHLKVRSEFRGQGIGTSVLNAIKAFATKKGRGVVLEPSPDKGKKGALHRFYRSSGFKKNKDNRYTSPFAPTMLWEPRK